MKVLTVKQPWAWLIFNAEKDVENRNWRTPIRGRVAIHVSAKNDPDEWCKALMFLTRNIPCQGLPKFDYEFRNGGRMWTKEPKEVTGAIIGTVDLVNCVKKNKSPWFQGKYGFLFRNPKLLKNPIPAKGQLGFWDFDIPEDACL